MRIDAGEARKLLKAFDFKKLFREQLGWDTFTGSLSVDGHGLTGIAHKRGFAVYICSSVPDSATRLKIYRVASKTTLQQMIIYADSASGTQVWQWGRREGSTIANREQRYDTSQTGEALIQKLEVLAVGIDEEEELTHVEVVGKATAAFYKERITKRFYDTFKDEHGAFMRFVHGIKPGGDREWYTSLMMNRMMFIYFIQKKGFLDGDVDYLQHRLRLVQERRGRDKFHSFYRYFLLRLFHEGLGKPETDRDRALEELLGKVPYLNGGFFEVHELERKYEIDIPDTAFEQLFKFFDAYEWTLDDRPLRKDNEINPDVVGYIFEKYINQKQMGAYYTKEDITEYISKNTVLPHIFDAAKKECAIAFRPDSLLWRMLEANPDYYIYGAVRQGVVDAKGQIIPLPKEVAVAIDEVSKRSGWNRPADAPFALPTETWREHVARRERCLEIRSKLSAGEVHEINDLVSLNLDIWQFARDAITNAEGPELLRAFWHSLQNVTVLDPACGSGAFLFATLRILETLYSDCIQRMRQFLEDLERSGEKHRPEKFKDFRQVLADIEAHPNESYYVLKSIIINNLFGVDIMEEAVEICKLRLFLKLAAQVANVEQIEPLPDIDFNIRAGNSLVGFTSLDAVRDAMAVEGAQGRLLNLTDNAKKTLFRIEEEADKASRQFDLFRKMQTEKGMRRVEFASSKTELRNRLDSLRLELDRYLAHEYDIDPDRPVIFKNWRLKYQPFHWFVEFYGIMCDGGFDVIIGNPPYVEYRKVADTYRLQPSRYASEGVANLYAFFMERSSSLVHVAGVFGMIVPAGVLGLDEALPLRRLLFARYPLALCSTYAIRPSKLFDGVDQRLCIFIGFPSATAPEKIFTTRYHHWNAEERDALFKVLHYYVSGEHPRLHRVPQIGDQQGHAVLKKLEVCSVAPIASYYSNNAGGVLLHYHRSPRYWIRAMDFRQYFKSATRSRSIHHFRDLHFRDKASAKAAGAILNSSLFFFWFISVGNGRNITGADVEQFPMGEVAATTNKRLSDVFDGLMKDYKANSFIRHRQDCDFQEFRPSKSKLIVDAIDRILSQHYEFNPDEEDYLINYDIKYRMGPDEAEDAE